MNILGIDPGNTKSGVVLFNGRTVVMAGVVPNEEVLALLDEAAKLHRIERCAIEMIESMGMAVGKETFETVRWVGRFQERWNIAKGSPAELIYRKDVKIHLCGSMRAKDGNVRQALIDKLGKPGTKHAPGPTYGCASHSWQALGVAVTALEAQSG
jgi:hypothetical protein